MHFWVGKGWYEVPPTFPNLFRKKNGKALLKLENSHMVKIGKNLNRIFGK
jgi:hypothetical protein